MTRFSLRSLIGTIAIAIVALCATAALTAYGSWRFADAQREATALQQERLEHAKLRIEDLLTAMVQISRTQVALIAPLRVRVDVMRSVKRLHLSADRVIYGSGVVFEPYAFPNAGKYFGIYAMRTASGGTVLQIIDEAGDQKGEPPWFLLGRNARGAIRFLAPYRGRTGDYVGVVQAFYDGGRFAGISIVDEKIAVLQKLLTQQLRAGDSVALRDANGSLILETGTGARGDSTHTLASRIRVAPWTIAMTSSMGSLTTHRTVLIAGIGLLLLGIWLVAIFAMGWVLRAGIYRDRANALLEKNAALEFVAYRDPLTGLPNRPAVIAHVDKLIHRFTRDRSASFSLMFIDLDRFAVINDSLGHAVGDTVLIMVAQRIAESIPFEALFGRLGGDEFVLCVEGDEQHADDLARSIIENINRPVTVDEHEIVLSGSIGVVMSSPRYVNADQMLRDADIAMYAAKNSGRSQFAVFNEVMHKKALNRLALEEKIRRAVKNRDFHPHYQPIHDIATGQIVSVESLARWHGPDGAGITPAEFIVAAEQSGLIATVDALIFARACKDARTLQEIAPEITFGINVSATMLARDEMIDQFTSITQHFGLLPSQFKLELTETAFMEHPQQGLRLLERARALGAQVLIDDFGMGYSSLSYVQRLPISGLKIDRFFVEPLAAEPQSVEIVRAIVGIAHALGVHVTAEGVETAEQLQILRDLGVQYAQGWFFSRALPFKDLVTYLGVARLPTPS